MRAQPLNEAERQEMTVVLARIQRAGTTVAGECGVDLRVELDDRGKYPFIAFRLHGYLPAKNGPTDSGWECDTLPSSNVAD